MGDDTYCNINLNTKVNNDIKKNKPATLNKSIDKDRHVSLKKKAASDSLSAIQLFKEIPQKVPFMGKPQKHTLSVALPVSLVENVQSDELRAYVVGNISRVLTIYGVNEVVLYNDIGQRGHKWQEYFALNLRFLETPQYLRKFLFPMSHALKYTGLQNPIDAPHHLRSSEWLPYRDGVIKVLPKKSVNNNLRLFADCGSFGTIEIMNPSSMMDIYGVDYKTDDASEDIYQRVTIRLDDKSLVKCKQQWKDSKSGFKHFNNILSGYLVSPEEPLTLAGLYWGYIVREADDINDVFGKCPFNDDGLYDFKIGTSEHGEAYKSSTKIPKYKNLLVVFGPVNGLEHIIAEPANKFDKYYNFCLQQKSRTIRTEEAICICLSILQLTSPHQ